MKITIDTSKDSSDDIKKAISFLQSLSGSTSVDSNIFSDNGSGDVSNPQPEMFNMFGDSSSKIQEPTNPVVETYDDLGSSVNQPKKSDSFSVKELLD